MQQVDSESAEFLQLHNRHPDLSSSFILAHHELESDYYYCLLQLLPLIRSPALLVLLLLLLSLREELSGLCSAHVILSALLKMVPHCQNCCGTGRTVHTAAEHFRLSELVHCMSHGQQGCTSHTFNNPLSTLGQHIALCQHWHGAKASGNNGTAQYLLSILAQRKSLCQ